MTAFRGRTRRIAKALTEALFPAGELLPAPDSEALLSAVERTTGNNRLLRRSLSSLLWWLELRYLSTHGRRFSAASAGDRRTFLRDQASNLLSGSLLRALSSPFRTAYLLDETNLARMHSRNGVRVPATLDEARWRKQITDATQLESSEDVECDVVVIGTGAGGAAAAHELAGRGLAVVLIEEGRYHDRREFSGKLTEIIPKLYRAQGATAALGNNIIAIPIGRNVGGTTTINSGTCLRTPDSTLADWCAEGLTDFTPENMAPYFELVENVLKVQQANPKHVGEIGRVIETGARRIGMVEMQPLSRNAEGCDGQGLCQFGCPTDAKQSTNVSFIPRALERGAFLFTGFRADQLLHGTVDGKKTVTGVIATGRNASGDRITLTVKARATVISMGTLLTPNFLRDNGVNNSWLGNNLSIHPAGAVTAWFPDRQFENGSTIPQGFGVYDLKEEGLMFEGGTIPFLGHGMFNPLQADDFVRFTERYQQTAYFGVMVKDTSRGKVRRGLTRDIPLITYRMNDIDFRAFCKGMDLLAKMYFAAGAQEVCFPGLTRVTIVRNEQELAAFWASNPKPRHFLVTAYHPLGTARIAATPDKGVCDENHKVFGSEGLYVMDGASVPSSLGANPQVTIMAMATRAARRLADTLSTH